MKILGVIPARFNSTRLPGKPLIDILGKPMIQRVYEQCQKSTLINQLIVATDDERILNFCNENNLNVCLTSSNHQSGTERCAEVFEQYPNFDFLINIQGDEPFINPLQIDDLIKTLTTSNSDIATLAHQSNNWDDINSNSNVKVVISKTSKALYFSRSPIPHNKNHEANHLIHIGLYGFKTSVLQKLVQLSPSILEISESLEQLRWLENDFSITVKISNLPNFSIDTQKDLQNLNDWIAANRIEI